MSTHFSYFQQPPTGYRHALDLRTPPENTGNASVEESKFDPDYHGLSSFGRLV